jgi:hypothetical protein
MTIRVSQPAILLAAVLALSGCIDVECPAEIDRPLSRERWCGHTGDIAAPANHQIYPTARPLPPDRATTVTTTTVTTSAPPPPLAAPQAPVTTEPMPPPGQPTQIR